MDTGSTTINMNDLDRLDGVRTRRILAFIFDYVIVALLTLLAGVAVFFIGILTLGLGWLLYAILAPLVAMTYVGLTMGSASQATPGMNFFALRIEREDGQLVDPWFAILHGVIFWAAHIILTPFLLVVSLFSTKKRLIQDILLGTVIIRSDV